MHGVTKSVVHVRLDRYEGSIQPMFRHTGLLRPSEKTIGEEWMERACNGELFIISSLMQCVMGVCTEFTKQQQVLYSSVGGGVVWMLLSMLALCA
jgi:hypothetical protein